MPIYEVQTPDGQVLEVQGDQMPTAQDLTNFTAKLFPAPSPQTPSRPSLPERATLPDVFNQPTPSTEPWQGGVVRSAFPGTLQPEDLLPAVRKIGGELEVGEPGNTHPDIIKGSKIPAVEIDQRGFVGPGGQFIDREAAAQGTGLATAKEPGRLHSTDLPAYKAELPGTVSEEKKGKLDEIERVFRARQSQLPWDTYPAKANALSAQLDQWRSKQLADLGITSVDITERPHLGEPLTQQQQETLFGKGLLGKGIGAAQRQIQGLASSMVQPEAAGMLMAGIPGVRSMPGVQGLSRITGGAFIPGMAAQATASVAQTAGYLSEGDMPAAIESASEAGSTALMLAMPIAAARLRSARLKQYAAETERPVSQQLDEVQESLANIEETDPERPALLRQQADLQQRLDWRQNWEDRVQDAAKGTGRTVTITDEDLGEGNISRPDGNGGILVNREVLHKLLEIDAKGNPKLADRVIQSVVNQEVIHTAIPNKEAEDYWHSLTDAERAFEESLYPFPEGTSDAMKGQEAVRRRMEQANGMTPLEKLVRTKHGPLASKSIMALENAFRATREVLATSGEDKQKLLQQLAILNRAQKRYEQAKKGIYASSVTGPTGVAEREVRPRVGEETPLRQQGETAAPQAPVETKKEVLLTPKDIALQTQREAGWDPKWPFVPADFQNKTFRDAIERDPNLSAEEKDRMFAAAEKLLGGKIGREKGPPRGRTGSTSRSATTG